MTKGRIKAVFNTDDAHSSLLVESMLALYSGTIVPHRSYIIDMGPNYRAIQIFRNLSYSNYNVVYLAINVTNKNWGKLFVEQSDVLFFIDAGWLSRADRIEKMLTAAETHNKRFVSCNWTNPRNEMFCDFTLNASMLHGSLITDNLKLDSPEEVAAMFSMLQRHHYHLEESLVKCPF